MLTANKKVLWLLRIAAALSLLYPPITAFSDPALWIGYIPGFVLAISPISDMALLHTIGVIEIILALWILSGWRVYIPALATAVFLIAIVATNMAQFPVLFRDISIALAAIALALLEWPQPEEPRTM